MRRRSGANWIVYDEMEDTPVKPIGELLIERFRTQDVLMSPDDRIFRAVRPRLAADVYLISEAVQQDRSWRTTRVYIEREMRNSQTAGL